MHGRTDDYQNLELVIQGQEEKEEKRNNLETTSSNSASPRSSTSLICESLGFYPELSFKEKTLILLFSLLAAYQTFGSVESASNTGLGYFTEKTELSQNISRGLASLFSLLAFFASLRGMGKGLKNLERYSDRINCHSKQLVQMKEQMEKQEEKMQALEQEAQELKEETLGLKNRIANRGNLVLAPIEAPAAAGVAWAETPYPKKRLC